MRPRSRFLLVTLILTMLALVPAVSAQDVTSPSMAPGDTFTHTFDKTGSSYFHCHPHPWMEGRITIGPATDATPETHVVRFVEPESESKSWKFEPAALTIRAGDTVQWVNEGEVSHQLMAWVSEDPDASPSGDHTHDHDDGETSESPALPLVPLLLGLGLVGLLRRR